MGNLCKYKRNEDVVGSDNIYRANTFNPVTNSDDKSKETDDKTIKKFDENQEDEWKYDSEEEEDGEEHSEELEFVDKTDGQKIKKMETILELNDEQDLDSEEKQKLITEMDPNAMTQEELENFTNKMTKKELKKAINVMQKHNPSPKAKHDKKKAALIKQFIELRKLEISQGTSTKKKNKTYVHHALSVNIRPWFKEHEIEDTHYSAPVNESYLSSTTKSNPGAFMGSMFIIGGIVVGKYLYQIFFQKAPAKKFPE